MTSSYRKGLSEIHTTVQVNSGDHEQSLEVQKGVLWRTDAPSLIFLKLWGFKH